MAWETGTATDRFDLLNKLVTFLTTNADLVTAGEEWTLELASTFQHADSIRGEVGINEERRILMAPGMVGWPPFYIGLESYKAIGATEGCGYLLNGAVGYAGDFPIQSQPGANASDLYFVRHTMWTGGIAYWFFATRSYLYLVTQSNLTFAVSFLGQIEPYSSPGEFPQPLLIAGNSGEQMYPYDGNTATVLSINGIASTSYSELASAPNDNLIKAVFRNVNGVWSKWFTGGSNPYSQNAPAPDWFGLLSDTQNPFGGGTSTLIQNLQGDYYLTDHELMHFLSGNLDLAGVVGRMPGCKKIRGSTLTSTSEVTYAGRTFVIFSNNNFVSPNTYIALEKI